MTQDTTPTLSVRLASNFSPAVFDLSGEEPFEIFLETRWGHTFDDDRKPLTIQSNGSVFDPSAALSQGFLELINLDTGDKINVDAGNASKSMLLDLPDKEKSYVTLERRINPHRTQDNCENIIPIHLAAYIKPLVQANKSYRIHLVNHDIGIEWWTYGDSPASSDETLPVSESGKLLALKETHIDFHAVVSIPHPPPISVSLSLTPTTIRMADSPATKLRIATTNHYHTPITVSTLPQQQFIRETYPWRSDLPCLNSILLPTASLQNFSITSIYTTKEFVGTSNPHIQHIGKHPGWSRTNFRTITLRPGIPHVIERDFLTGADAIKERMAKDGGDEFLLKIRPYNVWWCEGTLDDMFGKEETSKAWPQRFRLPLTLSSDDVVKFRLEQ